MTIVTTESRPTSADINELTSLQYVQTSTFDPFARLSTPSPFELLFAQQLGSTFSSDSLKDDGASETVHSNHESQVTNTEIPLGPRPRIASYQDGTDGSVNIPVVNPLTMNALTMPQSLAEYSLATSQPVPSNGTSSQVGPAIPAAVSTGELTNIESSNEVQSTLETEEPQSDEDNEFADATSSRNIIASQTAGMTYTNVSSLLNLSQQLESTKRNATSTSAAETSAQEYSGNKVNLKIASSTCLSQSIRGSNVGISDADDESIQVISTSSTQRSNKPTDDSIAMNPVIRPPTICVSLEELEAGEAISDQLANTIVEHLNDESNGDATSIHIQLEQPDLGTINLYLSTTNKVVSIRIVTQNPLAKKIIEGQMEDLRQALTVGGVDCGPFQVTCDSKGQGFSKPENVAPTTAPTSSRPARQPSVAVPIPTPNGRLNVVA
jgi:hypothetical protein